MSFPRTGRIEPKPTATWRQMRSGDWALRVQGQRWAVAFVWKTWERGYACAIAGYGGATLYDPRLAASKRRASAWWSRKQAWLAAPSVIPPLRPVPNETLGQEPHRADSPIVQPEMSHTRTRARSL